MEGHLPVSYKNCKWARNICKGPARFLRGHTREPVSVLVRGPVGYTKVSYEQGQPEMPKKLPYKIPKLHFLLNPEKLCQNVPRLVLHCQTSPDTLAGGNPQIELSLKCKIPVCWLW